MRHSTWLGPMVVLALGACSEGQRLSEITGRSEALAGPFDPLICTLGDECDQWGELIETPPAAANDCAPPEGEPRLTAWLQEIADVPCTLGRCAARDAQLVWESPGALVTLLRVELPSPMQLNREAGLWLARYAPDGTELGSQLSDFAIPPPGVEVQRNARLLSDAKGAAVLATARTVLPGDAPPPLTIERLRMQGSPTPRPPLLRMPVSQVRQAVFGPNGEILISSYFGDFFAGEPEGAALTLLDRHGRVLWNRPWPSAEVQTNITDLHIDAAGRITVLVWNVDASFESTSTVVRLDTTGRVLWQRPLAASDVLTELSVDEEGDIYVMAWRWQENETRVEHIDALGSSTVAWSVAPFGFWPELHRGRSGAWLTDRGGEAQPELWALPLDAQSAGAACEGRRYAWPGPEDSFFNGTVALAEGEQSDLYLASAQLVFKLEGMAP